MLTIERRLSGVFTYCVLPALIFIGCNDKDPVGSAAEPNLFPLSVGSTWTYEWRDSTGAPEPDTLWVSAVAETSVAGVDAAKLRFEEHWVGPTFPGGSPNLSVSVYHGLVSREREWVIYNDANGDPTYRRYKLPLAEGSSWDLKDPESEWHIGYVVLPVSNVTTPAGRFDACVPVQSTEYETGYTSVDTEYFADGVGLVMRKEHGGSSQVLVAYHIEPKGE